jgi:hypothetical protein
MAGADSRKPMGWSIEGVRRARWVVEHVERTSLGGAADSRRPVPHHPGIVRARVTTAIPTGTWDSPSSAGRAQIRHKDLSGAWVDSGDPVVVWNDYTMPSSLPINRVVKIAWIGGEWWLVSASCS